MTRCRIALGVVVALPLSALLLPVARSADEPKPVVIYGSVWECNALAFSPAGKYFAVVGSGSGLTIGLRDSTSGKPTAPIEIEGRNAVAISPDGKTLATGSAVPGENGVVRLYDLKTGKASGVLRNEKHGVIDCLAFSPDGKRLAVGTAFEDPPLRIWDVASGKVAASCKLDTEWITAVAFGPDGSELAGGTREGVLYLVDAASGELKSKLVGPTGFIHAVRVASTRRYTRWVHTVAFSEDGKTLLSAGSDSKIHHWNLATKQAELTFVRHTERFQSTVFSPDRRLLATGDVKGTVSIWDAVSGERLRDCGRHNNMVTALAFSPDGKMLASGDSRGVQLGFDTGREAQTIQLHTIDLPPK